MLEFDKVYGGKYLLIGDDRNGNLLEILYNVIDEDSINVFHALKCRSIFSLYYQEEWMMAEMTEEEADALDEAFTKNPPVIDPAKRGTGFFTRRRAGGRSITVDLFAADYLTAAAAAAHKTPAEIISEMIQDRMTASASLR